MTSIFSDTLYCTISVPAFAEVNAGLSMSIALAFQYYTPSLKTRYSALHFSIAEFQPENTPPASIFLENRKANKVL